MKARGVIKGQTIVLDEPLGLREGLSVEVEISPAGATADITPAEEETKRTAKRELLAKYGIKPTPSRGCVVTNEMVNRLRDELGI